MLRYLGHVIFQRPLLCFICIPLQKYKNICRNSRTMQKYLQGSRMVLILPTNPSIPQMLPTYFLIYCRQVSQDVLYFQIFSI